MPTSRFGIGCKSEAPEGAFMAVKLQPGYLRGASGKIEYPDALNEL